MGMAKGMLAFPRPFQARNVGASHPRWARPEEGGQQASKWDTRQPGPGGPPQR